MMLSGLAARAGTDEEAVIAAENQITKSQQTNNVELQAPLLADKYVATDEEGTVIFGKQANLADAKLTTFSSLELTDLKVTMFGDTAIATGTFTDKGTYKGKPFNNRGRFTDTWVKVNGKWLCVATHASLIKKA
jgi:ketosteroid isomerase-like protein